MSRVQDEPAFVLHRRPYRETSALIDVFTLNYGRLTLVARGASGPRNPWKGALQPFRALLLGWQGRTDLKNLTDVTPRPSPPLPAAQRRLYCGFYLNELIERLLPSHDPYPELFAGYARVLSELAVCSDEEVPLRQFELHLVSALGYGFSWDSTQQGPVAPGRLYGFDPDQGVVSDPGPGSRLAGLPGELLLAVAADRWDDPRARQLAKRVMRVLIDHLLNGRPLHSRRLFAGGSRNDEAGGKRTSEEN